MTNITLHIGQTLYRTIENALMIDDVNNRSIISDAYSSVLNTPLPIKPPIAMMQSILLKLRKKVKNGCPRCLSAKEMKKYMDIAKSSLRSYKKQLYEWLKENDIDMNVSGIASNPIEMDVHDLKSNI